jgi:hypothetical protein
MYLLPLFRGCTWSDVGAFASLSRALDAHLLPDLRAALVGVYLAAEDPRRALGWWGHVLAHPADQRLEVAQLVSASGVAKIEPFEPAFAAQLAGLSSVQQWSVYRGAAAGASSAYVTSGLELGAISQSKIADVPPGRLSVTSIIEATTERLAQAMDEDSGADFWRPQLWRLCGYQPEVVELLRSPEFTSLTEAAAFWVVRIANSPRWTPETADRQWRELAPKLSLLVEFATRLAPEYQRKFVEDMDDVYWWAVDNEHDITDALAKCVDLCFRIAKPPFATKSALGAILPSMALVYLDWEYGPERRVIRDAPDSSWLALEDACKRTNQVRLLGRGLNRLAQFAPKLVASTFVTSPGALLQTAESLAAVSFESAEQVVGAYEKSALAAADVHETPVEKLCALIEPITQAGGPNPVRRALREHLSGTKTLSAEQLRGHHERVLADLGIVRLAAIRQSVERVLAARVGIDKIETSNMRHALAMLTNVEKHRRQLKRLLIATVAGDSDWRLRHPRTTEWLARHPKLDLDAFTSGVDMRGEIEGVGEVRIAVEKDPLEALKLGTYVGSCLGRGGNLEYSAAAVVLDVNKQVIYARDARGAVVGRQLIAVSEQDELVCFSVYGSAKPALLEPLFRDFVRALASKLGIPLFGRNFEAYEIASILSHEWWDDSAWLDVVEQTEPAD